MEPIRITISGPILAIWDMGVFQGSHRIFTIFSLSFCKKYILFPDNKAKYYTIFPE